MSDATGIEACLLLAGGSSRRLHRDKLLVDRDARPGLRAMAERLRARAPVVVAADPRRPLLHAEGTCTWWDRRPGAGPLPALRDALERGSGAWLVVAAELLALDDAALDAMLHEAEAHPDADACVAEIGGREHPLCGVYRPAFAAALAEAEDGGELSLGRVLQRAGARVRRVAMPAASLAGLNDADDLRRMRAAS